MVKQRSTEEDMKRVFQVWHLKPVIPVPGGQRPEDSGKFESSLGYTVNSRPHASVGDPV